MDMRLDKALPADEHQARLECVWSSASPEIRGREQRNSGRSRLFLRSHPITGGKK
jgi:hypothetical protein